MPENAKKVRLDKFLTQAAGAYQKQRQSKRLKRAV